MKQLTLVLGLAITICSFSADLSARRHSSTSSIRTPGLRPKLESVKSIESRGRKTGLFTMQGRGGKKSILLSNNIFYRPSHDHDADNTNDWTVGQAIKVLKTKEKGTYILVNQVTGETMKGTIYHWD